MQTVEDLQHQLTRVVTMYPADYIQGKGTRYNDHRMETQ